MKGSREGISRREWLALLGGTRLLAQDATFSTDVKVVNVLAGVRDKDGNVIRNLAQKDFKLEEDGRVQTIKYFSQQSDLGLTLGLMIDTSGSQRFVLNDERRASRQFLRGVMREDRDQAFVIHFDGEVELLQDLTSSRKELEAALNDRSLEEAPPARRRPGWGGTGPPVSRSVAGTALYDAVLLASDELMHKQMGRKALILLSDGEDQGSRVSLPRCIEAAQRADTLVYSIYFGRSQVFRRPTRSFGGPGRSGTPPLIGINLNNRTGSKVLQRISRETGGAFFEVTDDLAIETVFERIEDELRSQYSLGYTPEKSGTGYRKIKVSVAQKGLKVQSREGYYSE